MWDGLSRSLCRVPRRLRQQLAAFLRKTRGTLTYAEFERRTGISASSLQRLELAQQNITIDTLEDLIGRLKCQVGDIFRT